MKFFRNMFGRKPPETQSVILLRQVPIRFEEPVRSWLGGLPQMPENIIWPRTEDGAPLQFVAQVCCADLPGAIWAGLGPRTGWLLLFVDGYSMEDQNHGGNVQVLHVQNLGPEREPPEDMGTYRHAMNDYIDYHTPIIRPGIPKMWRRWPVDIVVQDVPPPFQEDGETIWAPKPVDAEALYGGAAVNRSYLRLTVGESTRPLTWRGVLHLLDGLVNGMDSDLRRARTAPAQGAAPDLPEGFVANAVAAARLTREKAAEDIRQTEAQMEEIRAQQPADMARILAGKQDWISQQQQSIAFNDKRLADIEAYTGPGGDALLAAEVARFAEAQRLWLLALPEKIAALRTEILSRDLDAALPGDAWERIRSRLTAERTVSWYLDIRGKSARKLEDDLLSRYPRAMEFALREDVLDLYTRDAAGRAMIPPELLAELEPLVRDIGCGTAPHRMGGPHDVVQSMDEPGDMKLLFQIFSDYPMGWMWADVGGLFVQIRSGDLRAGRFDQIKAWMDGG